MLFMFPLESMEKPTGTVELLDMSITIVDLEGEEGVCCTQGELKHCEIFKGLPIHISRVDANWNVRSSIQSICHLSMQSFINA